MLTNVENKQSLRTLIDQIERSNRPTMFLEQVEQLAIELMQRHQLKRWKFRWKEKMTRNLGLCDKRKRTIFLSRVHAEVVSIEETTDTILHEIAHAITHGRCQSHGKEWKANAIKLGATPKACANLSREVQKKLYELYVAGQNSKHPDGHWVGICSSCSYEDHRWTKPTCYTGTSHYTDHARKVVCKAYDMTWRNSAGTVLDKECWERQERRCKERDERLAAKIANKYFPSEQSKVRIILANYSASSLRVISEGGTNSELYLKYLQDYVHEKLPSSTGV